VTVVDQSGKLLSGAADDLSTSGLDRSQIKYLHQIEDDIARKIEAILRPLTGPDNVRAQVAAALDFSQVEQTSETYRPNNDPRDQAMRSQQTTEATSQTPQGPQGVPGALSNTPPGAASAPLVQPPQGEAGGAAAGPTTASTSQRDSKVNYELDKTVRHTRTEVGTIKRLSVAVVVNHKRVVDKTGEAKLQPYDPKEMAQIQTLVREAMGFDKDRGDTVNVVNAPFLVPFEPEVVPFWKDPGNLPLAIEAGKWLLVAGLGLATLLMVRSSVRDLIRLSEVAATPPPAPEPPPAVEEPPPSPEELRETLDYERSIQRARDIARENPRLAAQVIRGWVTKGE
jgi:flagellar M-ring protein FliF